VLRKAAPSRRGVRVWVSTILSEQGRVTGFKDGLEFGEMRRILAWEALVDGPTYGE